MCSEVDIPSDFNYFIPNSVLSEMRRQLVDQFCQLNLAQKPEPLPIRGRNESSPPAYPYPYLYNISNRLSQRFYNAEELTAFELKGGDGPVMQCRHCIRYSLGYCVRRGGKQPEWKEPLYLQLGDGRRFQLEFDCKNCQMNVYA
jgi:putative protease